ncbi:MAG TPA: hypothetical protein ENI15_04215 [Spirochaetes bacterium]|nr:hypothetical protein [Spirochaetota bacterium]
MRLIPNSEVKRIKGETVTVMNVYTQEEEDIKGVDMVVMSVGNKSERGIYDELKGKIEKEIYFVGDAVAPRLIEQVVLEAEELARRI